MKLLIRLISQNDLFPLFPDISDAGIRFENIKLIIREDAWKLMKRIISLKHTVQYHRIYSVFSTSLFFIIPSTFWPKRLVTNEFLTSEITLCLIDYNRYLRILKHFWHCMTLRSKQIQFNSAGFKQMQKVRAFWKCNRIIILWLTPAQVLLAFTLIVD